MPRGQEAGELDPGEVTLSRGALLQAVLSRMGAGFVSANPSQDAGVVFCFHRWFTTEERRRRREQVILLSAHFVSVSLS